MGSHYPDQRAASAWKQRQEYWVTQDNSTERHHREWAEGLEKYPQGRWRGFITHASGYPLPRVPKGEDKNNR